MASFTYPTPRPAAPANGDDYTDANGNQTVFNSALNGWIRPAATGTGTITGGQNGISASGTLLQLNVAGLPPAP